VTPDEFKQEVRKQAGPWLSEPSLHCAVDACVKEGHTHKTHVDGCLKLAELLDYNFRSRCAASSASVPLDDQAPTGLVISSAYRVQQIRPQVESVRQTLFGSVDPPFTSPEEAVVWLEQNDPAQQPPRSQELRRHLTRRKREIQTQIDEWEDATGLDWRGHSDTRFLVYEKPGETGLRRIRLQDPDLGVKYPAIASPLARLDRATQKIAEATGFEESKLIHYILVGEAPTLPHSRQSVKYLSRSNISRVEVSFDFFTRDISYEGRQEAVRNAKKVLNTTNRNLFSSHEEHLVGLVEQFGEPPAGRGNGGTAYWERIRQEYVRPNGKRYKDWRGIKRKYHALRERLREYGLKPHGTD
jgi:hypothetical protein